MLFVCQRRRNASRTKARTTSTKVKVIRGLYNDETNIIFNKNAGCRKGIAHARNGADAVELCVCVGGGEVPSVFWTERLIRLQNVVWDKPCRPCVRIYTARQSSVNSG